MWRVAMADCVTPARKPPAEPAAAAGCNAEGRRKDQSHGGGALRSGLFAGFLTRGL
jgi:hypothetical protein